MYSTGDVKTEYCSGSKVSICQACLSTNRKLSSAGECVQIYQNICLDSYPVKSDLFFCWECIAVMKKIQAFREKVWTAQKILSHLYTNRQIELPKCLSKLETTKIIPDNIFIFDEHECLLNGRVNVKHNIEIKQELEFEIDNESYNYEPLTEDVKVENEKPINTYRTFEHSCKKKRTKKYRMILNGNGGKALQKIKIGISDVATWLEKERTSHYYRNLVNKCDKCVMKLKRKENLEEHHRTHHDESIAHYACDICRTHFVTKSSMTSHVARHFYIRHCNICGYEAYSASHMNDHMRGHKKTVQCLDCLACYDNVRKFFTHYKAMHCVYICDHCDKKCKSKRSLEKHMRRHLTHECKQCNMTFKSYWTLRHHSELKHVTKRTEDAFCVQCDTQFRNPLLYRRHLATSTAHRHERGDARIKKEKVPCPECENVYSRRSYMMNHYRHVHRNQSKYYCLDCDKYFLNRTRYVDHRRYNHEGFVKEKDKLCNICDRGFAFAVYAVDEYSIL